jgi:hypothetical protein
MASQMNPMGAPSLKYKLAKSSLRVNEFDKSTYFPSNGHF